MGPNAVADAIAQKYNSTKSQVFDHVGGAPSDLPPGSGWGTGAVAGVIGHLRVPGAEVVGFPWTPRVETPTSALQPWPHIADNEH